MISTILGDLTFSAPVLFAARSRRGADTGEILLYLAIAVVVIGVVCGVLYAAGRHRHAQRFNSHSSLFNGLCDRHELDRASRSLLKQIVSQHQLKYPAQIFIEPRFFDPNGLGGSVGAQELQVAALRNQLFG